LHESRVLVRPRRFRDGVHIRICLPDERTHVYDTSTVAEDGRRIADTWFVNVEGIRIYAVPDPNLQRSGPNAYGEQTDDQGQFLGTAGLLD